MRSPQRLRTLAKPGQPGVGLSADAFGSPQLLMLSGIGPSDHLREHSVTGLPVVDTSITPTLVSGNTNALTLMIAEKVAAMMQMDRLS